MDLVGLFFGSFNPIHHGHLAIARYLLDEGYCGKVWFVISPRNPWKEDYTLLEEGQRLEIVKAAIGGDHRLKACDIEFTLPRPSYTYQTLRVLSQKYPDKRFTLVMGGDNLQRFHLWKNYQEISAHFPLLVYPRPGMPLPENSGQNITVIQAPLLPVSSTAIRRKLSAGEDISGEVPAAALPLIMKYYCKQ